MCKLFNTMALEGVNSQVNPYDRLNLVRNADGSFTRKPIDYPSIPPTSTPVPNNPTSVLSKDITYNTSNNTWLRIYLPARAATRAPARLPVIFYYHGGAFVICSPDLSIFHLFCSDMAAALSAVVVSVGYRLAPEHRLPAAYEDAVDALHWIKTSWAEVDWLRDHADLSNCFLMGLSAGGNLAYNAGLRAAYATDDLLPLRIRGLILQNPFFGGTRRTPTELRLVDDPVLPLVVSDLAWELALPVGADRDHEYCNPTAGGGSEGLEEMRTLGWKVLVTGFEGDPLYDHQRAVVEMMEKKGVAVEGWFNQGGQHGIEASDASRAEKLYVVLKIFII